MILSTTFGFSNAPIAYEQMGYASIIWYIVGALAFFLPSSLMFAEYGSALKTKSGGYYNWIEAGIGSRWAFIGTFMWLSTWVISLIQAVPNLWVSASAGIFGRDTTQHWHFIGNLTSTQCLGIMSLAFVFVTTFIAIKGLDKITWATTIGGVLVIILPIVFCLLSILLIILNHGQLAQPISGVKSFLFSPNPQFKSTASIMSFVVYAIFSYAGVEAVSGVINHLKNPGKNFPRGVLISVVFTVLLYMICIILCGAVVNWKSVMGKSSVTIGNVAYVLMYNLGLSLGAALGWSTSLSAAVGHGLVIFSGIATVITGIGGYIVLLYSPLKSFMFGSNTKIWPKWILHLNKHGMPSRAMTIQGIIVCAVLFFISFGGNSAKELFQILTDMSNVASTAQYIPVILAFPFFKEVAHLDRPYVAFHSKFSTWCATIVVLFVLVFGVIFSFVQPLILHDYVDEFWAFVGPVAFIAFAWIFYDWRTSTKRSVE